MARLLASKQLLADGAKLHLCRRLGVDLTMRNQHLLGGSDVVALAGEERTAEPAGRVSLFKHLTGARCN